MGDRANICIKQHYGESTDNIYLYTHWGGSSLPRTLARALERGKDRWDDEPYLARIIFSEMIKQDIDGTTGFGIATYPPDNSHPIIYVDCKTQTVSILDHIWPFKEFVDMTGFVFQLVGY